MEPLFAIAIGVLVAVSVYMFLARDLPRNLIGFVLLGTGVNLSILAAGRIGVMTPPLIQPGAETLAAGAANPLPQALVLTAIVIGFGLAAFALTLIVKSHYVLGSERAEDLVDAEGETVATPKAAEEKREAA